MQRFQPAIRRAVRLEMQVMNSLAIQNTTHFRVGLSVICGVGCYYAWPYIHSLFVKEATKTTQAVIESETIHKAAKEAITLLCNDPALQQELTAALIRSIEDPILLTTVKEGLLKVCIESLNDPELQQQAISSIEQLLNNEKIHSNIRTAIIKSLLPW